MDSLKIIATFESDFEANLALGLLKSHDIPCVLNNEMISSVFAIPSAGFTRIKLLVNPADADRALGILAAAGDLHD